ncbi:hypothetical protein ACJJTC_010662 [Scirpophaga incertulas]
MVGLFEEFMLLLFDHHAPVKIISIKPDKSFPWVTETLKQMMHLRNQALRVYRATKSESDKISWKDLQVMVRTSLDAEKRAFFNHFVNSQVRNYAALNGVFALHVSILSSVLTTVKLFPTLEGLTQVYNWKHYWHRYFWVLVSHVPSSIELELNHPPEIC